MKKILAIFCAAVLSLSVAGCGNTTDDKTNPTNTNQSTTQTSKPETKPEVKTQDKTEPKDTATDSSSTISEETPATDNTTKTNE